MARIKICGLMRMEDVEAVNLYRPDYVGFIFAIVALVILEILNFKLILRTEH